MIGKKRLHFHFGCHFCKTKAYTAVLKGFHTFCPNVHRFCPDFKGFCQIFTKSKVLAVRLHPLHPTGCTTLNMQIKQCKIHFFTICELEYFLIWVNTQQPLENLRETCPCRKPNSSFERTCCFWVVC